jgi:multiple sugar transport system permease protein
MVANRMEKAEPETGAAPAAQRARRRRGRIPWSLLVPAAFFLLVLVVLPLLVGLYTSLTDLNQYTLSDWVKAPFVGLANYVDALTQGNALGASAPQSVLVSVLFSVLTTLFITPIGIGAALVVRRPTRVNQLLRGLFLVPYAIPVFVNAILWRLIFMNGFGLLDRVLASLHLASINTFWLIGPESFWAMVIADVWAAWPFVYLMVLAGLQGIPQELYESAAIDGAPPRRMFFSITLPLLRPVLGLAVLLSTLNHFNNFTLPFVMFGTPPPPQADVLPLNVYVTSFETFNFGLGAAMSVLTLVIMLIPAIFYIRALRLGERVT